VGTPFPHLRETNGPAVTPSPENATERISKPAALDGRSKLAAPVPGLTVIGAFPGAFFTDILEEMSGIQNLRQRSCP
jgi:hypothetical protein